MNNKKKVRVILGAIVGGIGGFIISKMAFTIPDYYKANFGLTSDVRKSIARLSMLSFIAGAIYVSIVVLISIHIDKYYKEK